MILGYVRVSSKDQNEERQIVKMHELGIEDKNIFIDKQSGKDFDREAYKKMKTYIREGDLIYVDSLDRLGRDYDGIIREWKHITRDLNVDIVCLDKADVFDSRKFKSMGDMGKLQEDLFLSLLSYVAEQERKKIKQRQAEGIAIAKAQGKQLGRPKHNIDKVFIDVYLKWKDKENPITATKAMDMLGMKRNTFYRRVEEYEGSK
jgi:DNA invertase Pin-like site-specific DNA recombinase